MSPHLLKLRFRRFWRRRVVQMLSGVRSGGQFVEKNGFSRLPQLRAIWRFLFLWLGAAVVMIGLLITQLVNLRQYYQVYEPVPGGRYTEGIAGSFTTANPMYAVSDVDTTVSRLIFAGLLKYDEHNQLTGDLAQSWSADPTGKVYTIRLRPNLTWQDGQSLTTDDVVYTYRTIQNPDAQSPLYTSWKGVVVKAVDDQVVTFTLPNPLSSFPSGLTNGIVPKHLLGSINPIDLRSASFNTAEPVGSGPFRWSSIGISGVADNSQAQIVLAPFARYWAGAPKLTSFNVYAFADSQAMVQAYKNQEITAMAGLDSLPASIARSTQTHVYHLPLTAGVYVFFKTTLPVFSDPKVRQALVAAADRRDITRSFGYPVQLVDEPLLNGQLGYDAAYAQNTGDTAAAKALLDAAGWHMSADGFRHSGSQRLGFTLTVRDTSEYRRVAALLAKEWHAVGIDVQEAIQSATDFESNLALHQYDAILDGISIGEDPDVFVYWDSSQNDPRSATRFNFSEYHSNTVDVSLEAGRTRLDPQLRAVKYKSFLQSWKQDAPALGLYQPSLLYVSHEDVYGLDNGFINSDADRFRNVQNWMIHLGWVTR